MPYFFSDGFLPRSDCNNSPIVKFTKRSIKLIFLTMGLLSCVSVLMTFVYRVQQKFVMPSIFVKY